MAEIRMTVTQRPGHGGRVDLLSLDVRRDSATDHTTVADFAEWLRANWPSIVANYRAGVGVEEPAPGAASYETEGVMIDTFDPGTPRIR